MVAVGGGGGALGSGLNSKSPFDSSAHGRQDKCKENLAVHQKSLGTPSVMEGCTEQRPTL